MYNIKTNLPELNIEISQTGHSTNRKIPFVYRICRSILALSRQLKYSYNLFQFKPMH